MDEHLTPISASNVQRVALLELIARTRADKLSDRDPMRIQLWDDFRALPPSVRSVLSDQRAEQLIPRLIASNALRLKFEMNTLAHACEQIERQWWEEALLQYFVGSQASTTMIQALFSGVTRSRIERMRRDLGAAPPTKPCALSDDQATRVFDIWSDLQGAPLDLRERYVELHQRCAGRYTLATLFAALNLGEVPAEPDRACNRTGPRHDGADQVSD
ncbi:hypothetical protein [Paraburkholderia sp. HD33-4]|uniref:hypothetical protein n=1 Tax=Paraburkholderia sp. HD33-4 TaxID=2883242 RepID=UPI001F254CC4|nr:hypothetical protein [Paraburkholderia sp. HD33-4]